jgi:hypothetical protein
MVGMAQWAVIIPADRWATERLFQHDTLTVTASSEAGPQAGDDALLMADEHAVAVGRFTSGTEIAYTRRAFDEPVPAGDLKLTEPVTALDAESYRGLAEQLGAAQERKTWLVSVALPIEAPNQADAVRQFWSYVAELGPAELPAFVWPSGDELAMQAFVLGVEANQDPEEDDDED